MVREKYKGSVKIFSCKLLHYSKILQRLKVNTALTMKLNLVGGYFMVFGDFITDRSKVIGFGN